MDRFYITLDLYNCLVQVWLPTDVLSWYNNDSEVSQDAMVWTDRHFKFKTTSRWVNYQNTQFSEIVSDLNKKRLSCLDIPECQTQIRGVGRNCRKGGRQKPFGAERRKFGGVTGSHTSCLMTQFGGVTGSHTSCLMTR